MYAQTQANNKQGSSVATRRSSQGREKQDEGEREKSLPFSLSTGIS